MNTDCYFLLPSHGSPLPTLSSPLNYPHQSAPSRCGGRCSPTQKQSPAQISRAPPPNQQTPTCWPNGHAPQWCATLKKDRCKHCYRGSSADSDPPQQQPQLKAQSPKPSPRSTTKQETSYQFSMVQQESVLAKNAFRGHHCWHLR